jgi:hypothetical protein
MTYDDLMGLLARTDEARPNISPTERLRIELESFIEEYPFGFGIENWPITLPSEDYDGFLDLSPEVEEWLADHVNILDWTYSDMMGWYSVIGFKNVNDAIHFRLRWEPC